MKTLEDYLEQDAALYPDKLAVICGDEQCTYAELWQRVINRIAELTAKSSVSVPSPPSTIWSITSPCIGQVMSWHH